MVGLVDEPAAVLVVGAEENKRHARGAVTAPR
jgi:hypothetical protein